MEIKKIYFDMDGVLADFSRGVKELCGIDSGDQDKNSKEKDDQMWEAIKNTDHFYDRLEFMEGAEEMFNRVYDKYGDKCESRTATPKPKRGIGQAADDKRSWVKRMLNEDIVVNIVVKEEKKNFVTGKDCILIDDRGPNIDDWVAEGGTGIHHKSSEDTINLLEEMGII